jgi:hypothetical protein
MHDLAQKTKPGPFGKRTHEMGNYIGIRDRGRLIAMAGERMQLDGYVEISAVCVDDAWRGRGLAGRLVNVLRREIEQRGETPCMFEPAFSLGNEVSEVTSPAGSLIRMPHGTSLQRNVRASSDLGESADKKRSVRAPAAASESENPQ